MRFPVKRWGGLFVAVILVGMCQGAWAQGGAEAVGTPIEHLYGDAYLDAQNARDYGDRFAAAFRNCYRWQGQRAQVNLDLSPLSEAAQADYEQVVEAYREVSRRFPNTEVAAYSQMRLSYFYQERGEWDLSIHTAREVAKTYAGTSYGSNAAQRAFEQGLIRVQSETASTEARRVREAHEQAGAAKPQDAAKEAARRAETQAFLDKLDTTDRDKKFEGLIKSIVSRNGMRTIALIEERLATKKQSNDWEYNAIFVLASIGTKTAQATLLLVALNKTGSGDRDLQAWAAQSLVQVGRSGALDLLSPPVASSNPKVDAVALRALRGMPLEPQQFKQVAARLKSDVPDVRWLAALALAEEFSGQYTAQAVEVIGEALGRVVEIPDDGKITRAHHGWALTATERNYERYIEALSRLKNADRALDDLTGKAKGRACDALLISRAFNKDLRVHEGIVRVARDPEAGMFRAWAVRGLGDIGTDQDIALLKELAEQDQLERAYSGIRRDQIVPGRSQQEQMELGQAAESHPVRLEAREAIRLIEGRAVVVMYRAIPARLLSEIMSTFDQAERDGKLTPMLTQQLAEMASHGVDVAAFLKEEYRRRETNVQRSTVVIKALEAMGTTKAKEALRGIALKPGREGYALGRRAVEAYAALSKQSGEIAQLLASTDEEVKQSAVRAMEGLPLDVSAIKAMETLLKESKSGEIHRCVAQTFGKDPRQDTAEAKVEILMAASTNLGQLDDADKVMGGIGASYREMALVSYAEALMKMQNSGPALKRHLNDATQLPRQLAAIALAWQGNQEAHDEAVKVTQSEDGILRYLAVLALKNVATKQDEALLEGLAKSDPYRRPSLSCINAQRDEWYYPVRDAANAILKK